MKTVVLYVDDERNNRLVLRHSLSADFEVLLASSGSEALEVLARQPVQILLADYRMPGMTGVELATTVRARHPGVFRLVVTAYAEEEAISRAVAEGTIQRLLTKPWRTELLCEALRLAAGAAQRA